jgi:hypothetical protein
MAGLTLGAALIIILLTSNLTGIIFGAGVAAVAAYFLIRPPSHVWYVETAEDSLIVKLLTTTRIELRGVRSVELWRLEYPTLIRGFLNLFVMFDRLFGGRLETIKPDAPPRDVIVRFRKWVWVFMPLPPFVIPKRNWVLMVEDAELLRDDLNKRLGLPAREAATLEADTRGDEEPGDANTASETTAEMLRAVDEGERPFLFPESLRATAQKGRLLDEPERRHLRLELAKLVREGALDSRRVAQVLEAEGWGADAAFDFAESVVREALGGD